jgi:putative redox protein
MEAKVTWNQKMSFNGMTESGFPIPLDTKVEEGGDGSGSKPMELIAVGLAGCTAMDVISILAKKRQEVSKFEVSVSANRADEHPRVFTEATILYKVTGKNIDPSAVERAIQLSAEKYCPAQSMLSKAFPIHTRYEIIEE